ncbi:MAG: T9SS type A sorting domain-containing protein [Bacteroidia bacterium]
MKRYFLLITALVFDFVLQSQNFYQSFGNLALQSFTAGTIVTQYTTVPSNFSLINDVYNNNAGSTNNPNAPFHIPSLKTTGWAVTYNTAENDTFLVSTSWIDTTGITVDRWVITPTVAITSSNTVIMWRAKSPDANFPDGYEVYGTNKTGTLTPTDFNIGDRLFSLPDGHTSGGGEKSEWTYHAINVGAFNGQTLRFAFRNNSTDMFQLWIDDIKVAQAPGNIDGSVLTVSTPKYFLTGISQQVSAVFKNTAAPTIYTVNLNYQYGTSSPVSQTFIFPNGLGYSETAVCIFALPYSFSSPGNYPVKVWTSLPNNLIDQNSMNDTASVNVCAITTSALKNVLIEQFVSANNGESPDAQEKVLALQSPNVIVVNIHDNDSLKEANSTGILYYRKQYATATFDRVLDSTGTLAVVRPYYNNRLPLRLNSVTPASITIINKIYNTNTKVLSFTVKADFVGEVKGDYRLNAYLVENNVSGTSADTSINGYNQLNNYYFVPWSPYYLKGYYSSTANSWVLNAWQYKHQRTLVHSFDGSFGIAGVIPQTGGTTGQSYQTTYTMTVPTFTNGICKFNPDNIYLIGFVAEYLNASTGAGLQVLNVAQDKLTSNPEVVGIKEEAASITVSLFPNPTNGILYLNGLKENSNYSISVYDLLGKCVLSKSIKNSYLSEKIDLSGLPEGAYLLTISSGGKTFRTKVLKEGR